MLSFADLKKNLKKSTDGFKVVKLALLADSASQFIHQAIKGYGIELQINFDIYEADYNQIDLQVYDPSSELYRFKPDFIFIVKSTEHLIHSFYNVSQRQNFAAELLNGTDKLYQHLTQSLFAKVIINTFIEINDGVFGQYAAKTDNSFLYQLRKLNLGLMDLAQQNKSLFVADLASLSAYQGYQQTFDPKMYLGAHMVFSIDFLPAIAQSVTQIISAVNGSFKKCLILDLDNTLWGGVIGDDGMEGIQIGSLGLGKAFTELQLWCRELKNRGIILAVCSKNTEAIAREPFEKHPDMVLKLDDIAIFVANWNNKVDNIRHIQQVLNIGFESMVFLDDNPFERQMVASAIAELTIPDLPEDPAEYLMYLRTLNLFETASFTEEDQERTNRYQQESKRAALQTSFENETDFLTSLGMRSTVKSFDPFSIPRVAQLIQRSNQFNLRTIRYNEDEVAAMAASPDYFTFSFTLEDKLGDHGLIAAVILKKLSDIELFIDTWVMSCRVLKRSVENFILNNLVTLAAANGFTQLTGEYIATKKNDLVKDLYKNLGFQSQDNNWHVNTHDYIAKENLISKKNEYEF